MYYDSVHVYPAFLSGRKFTVISRLLHQPDICIMTMANMQYQIGSKEKILDQNSPGNLLTLHRENCELYGEGKINLGANLGQMKLTTVEMYLHNSIENKTELNVMLGMDFYMADNIISVMADEIDSMPSLPAVDLNNPVYTKGVSRSDRKRAF